MARLSLVIAVLALVLSALSLWSPPAASLPGRGLDDYDFSTAEAAWRSGMDIQQAHDMRAMLELGALARKEIAESATVVDAVDFKSFRILFVKQLEYGKQQYKCVGMKKVPGEDIWIYDHISPYRVRSTDKALAKRMEDWAEKSEKDPGE